MKRHREQVGYVYKASGVWYVRHHDNRIEDGQLIRKQVSTRVGTVEDFPSKSDARHEAKRILEPINRTANRPESVQTVCSFAQQQFFPDHEKQVKPSTLAGYRARWRQLQPWCGELRMRDASTPDIQRILEAIHKNGHLNHDSLRSLRALLKLIFDHAIRLGVLQHAQNPVDKARVPKRHDDEPASDTYAYSIEEVQRMLSIVPEPARTAIATAAFTGIRRGELAGLLWESFDSQKRSLYITRSIWEGHVTKPKTKKSSAPVPVIKPLAQILEVHRVRSAQERAQAAQKEAVSARKRLAKELAPETREHLQQVIANAAAMAANPPLPKTGPIFASANGTPLNMNNLLNRQILPALDRCACGKARSQHAHERHAFKTDPATPKWHGWHAFRRGLGTNLKRLGVDLKTIQDILRHAHIATTADIYVKEVSENAVAAMGLLERRIESELHSDVDKGARAYSAASLQ